MGLAAAVVVVRNVSLDVASGQVLHPCALLPLTLVGCCEEPPVMRHYARCVHDHTIAGVGSTAAGVGVLLTGCKVCGRDAILQSDLESDTVCDVMVELMPPARAAPIMVSMSIGNICV